MGLDQYLKKRVQLNKDGKSRIYKDEELYYWRKNYAIDDWFHDKVWDGMSEDNCVDMLVDPIVLIELRDILKKIISQKDLKKSLKVAQDLLPADDYTQESECITISHGKIVTKKRKINLFKACYLPDFKHTYEKLNEIINDKDFYDTYFYYHIWY